MKITGFRDKPGEGLVKTTATKAAPDRGPGDVFIASTPPLRNTAQPALGQLPPAPTPAAPNTRPLVAAPPPTPPENLLDFKNDGLIATHPEKGWKLDFLDGLERKLETLGQPDPQVRIAKEFQEVQKWETEALNLTTPEQFQARSADFKARLQAGATLEDIRTEAYAVARRAAQVALGKRPFDSQVKGALAMDSGRIAEMGTGEGKTLTALMPLYLSSLSGKGSHLITVNDFLARTGFEQNKPALDLLGVKAGLVLKDMPAEAKRQGYNADVTYLSNDTLGFDYLNDRMARDPSRRVQREPFAALVDEIDQVLLDEARVPLIISSKFSEQENLKADQECQFFSKIVENLKPGSDFRVDPENHAAFLTEHGNDVVANEVALAEAIDKKDQSGIARGLQLRGVLDRLGQLLEDPEPKPGLSERLGHFFHPPSPLPLEAQIMFDQQRDEKEQKRVERERLVAEKEALQAEFPGVNLYLEENIPRVHYLDNAVTARGLFKRGIDYTVENGEVQIVDEFKGRISEGRRYSNGLHQALEAKEGLTTQPETRTTASITYPNLLRRYQRLAGMTGTAHSSEKEFRELVGLEVVQIDPNSESRRVDHPDVVFPTTDAKLAAVPGMVRKCFEEGVPILVGTRSVAVNKYVSSLLDQAGIPNQALNAEDVKTNTPAENEMIANAGLSGAVTVATNMAGRGVDIKPDKVNYKKLYLDCYARSSQGQPTIVNVEDAEEAKNLAFWFDLSQNPAERIPYTVSTAPNPPSPSASQVLIHVNPTRPGESSGGGPLTLSSQNYPGKKLVVLSLERNFDVRIDNQLRGRAGRQGAPGETRFLLSLEDDLLRIFGEEKLERMKLLVPPQGVEGDPTIGRWVDEAQARVQGTYAETRLNSAKYDQVQNPQREIVWSFRDALVDSRPDLNPDAPPLDVKATALDWMTQAWNEALSQELGDKKHPKEVKLQAALAKVGQDFGYSLVLDPATKSQALPQRLAAAIEESYNKLEARLPGPSLDSYQWGLMVDIVDEVWQDQLEELESLKQGANLQTFAGKEPFEAYKEMSTKAFDQMWKRAHQEFTRRLLPQMAKDADFSDQLAARSQVATSSATSQTGNPTEG